jgi:hypothetical protein
MRRPTFAAAVAALTLALSGLAAQAAEITVLAGMGVVSAIRDLAPAFEQKTGHKVIISQEQIPTMNEKIGPERRRMSPRSHPTRPLSGSARARWSPAPPPTSPRLASASR